MVNRLTFIDEEPISRSNRNHKRNKITVVLVQLARNIIIFLLLILSVATFFGYRYVSDAVGAKDVNSTKFISVEIPENSGSSYIGQLLESAGVIRSGKVFNYYTKFKNISNLKSGYYNLQPSMTMDEIIEALQKKEVINLRNHLLVQSWLKKDIPSSKSPRRLKLIHQLKRQTFINWT